MEHRAVRHLPSFDPKAVPVVGVDRHLPTVPAWALTEDALRQRFAGPPPWSPEFVRERPFSDRAPAEAAVLIPIVLARDGKGLPNVLLTERTTHLSSHSGQIAFPGGKVDETDASMADAALREAWEEVGLAAEFVDVLGTLPDYQTSSAYLVTPVVALVREGFALRPNPHEVSSVFEIPLDFLMNPSNHRHHVVEWQGDRREWLSIPYEQRLPGGERVERFVWGATAGMLRNLYRFLVA